MANIEAKKEKLQQRINELTQKLEALNVNVKPLSKDSEGIPELLNSFNAALEANNVSSVELFEYLLKAKRTGMTLVRKTSAQ